SAAVRDRHNGADSYPKTDTAPVPASSTAPIAMPRGIQNAPPHHGRKLHTRGQGRHYGLDENRRQARLQAFESRSGSHRPAASPPSGHARAAQRRGRVCVAEAYPATCGITTPRRQRTESSRGGYWNTSNDEVVRSDR